ncbi:hypothetical protein BC828DRAFT_390100 [Blastocladiella britannica]|nr:hypothetical protein BC828DRAFT_390100 [Blastocladiella britannica]
MIDHVVYNILAHLAGTARTPEEALAVLDVLPKNRAPSVLAAVLSRGFLEYEPALAIKHGHGLALLPHYPSYILFDTLEKALGAAGTLGDLLTIKLLRQLAGPESPGRQTWYQNRPNSFINQVIGNGHTSVFEWTLHVSRDEGIQLEWQRDIWDIAAKAGYTEIINWAIAHDHVKNLDCAAALISTRFGDTSVRDWWIAQQPNQEAVMTVLNYSYVIVEVTRNGVADASDWWWAYTGSKLPEPTTFALVVNAALTGLSLAVVECWWARFLEHRTPEHRFGGLFEVGDFKSVSILDWYWRLYHENPDCFALNDYPHGLSFVLQWETTFPVLQWAVAKCAELGDGQKLMVADGVINWCFSDGCVDLLDTFIRSKDAFIIDWPQDILSKAIMHGQLKVLEWWERNQGSLPPQDLYCGQQLCEAASRDASNVIEWWYAQYPVSKSRWQEVCIAAIRSDALRVQLWLLDHHDLFVAESDENHREFAEECIERLDAITPFTLEFYAAIGLDLDLATVFPIPSMTMLFWYCCHANVIFTSLLPLQPEVVYALLNASSKTMLEWWLQEHIATGHRLVLPTADDMDDLCDSDEELYWWVCDVVVTRKLPVFVESDDGNVQYTLPPPPPSE